MFQLSIQGIFHRRKERRVVSGTCIDEFRGGRNKLRKKSACNCAFDETRGPRSILNTSMERKRKISSFSAWERKYVAGKSGSSRGRIAFPAFKLAVSRDPIALQRVIIILGLVNSSRNEHDRNFPCLSRDFELSAVINYCV